MIRRTDVLIIGAGPAGAVAAFCLAPARDVLLVDALREPRRNIGESLLPAAKQLLSDIGLIESFERLGAAPWHANRFVWGTPSMAEADFLRDPAGHGWHLDRTEFEICLRRSAIVRGAPLLAPVGIESIEQKEEGFAVILRSEGGLINIFAKVIIDAGGRTAPAASRLGAKRLTDLPLLCSATHGKVSNTSAGAGVTFVEAVEHGWWYTAPIPGGRRIVAFHTDADNPIARTAATRDGLLTLLNETVELSRLLAEAGFEGEPRISRRVASGSLLQPSSGEGWLAAGDAALTFDPLASRGLFNAIFLGFKAAAAVNFRLDGKADAFSEYNAAIAKIRKDYVQGLAQTYAEETRWPRAPFWHRRYSRQAHAVG
jgi:flavin-dependent dehydrogenase